MLTLQEIFTQDVPLIDVRSEVEFTRGAFPAAVNLPILCDAERHQVGLCYRHRGPAAATALGHQLVDGDKRKQRILAWGQFLAENPTTHLYCFRGGQRSSIACEWLAAVGHPVPRIPGGYKAMRAFLLEQYQNLPALLIIAGQTGVGKTALLTNLQPAIDLEAMANHRGSAFGGMVTPQPSQIDFENLVAIQLLKHKHAGLPVCVEDESRFIGQILLPSLLQTWMNQQPLVVVQDSLENRIERIYQEYIVSQWDQYQSLFRQDAGIRFENYLLHAVDAIRKRLGGLTHRRIRNSIQAAMIETRKGNTLEHQSWIQTLLQTYYDPMYDYQLQKKADRIIFSGSPAEVTEWRHHNIHAA